MRFPVSLTGWIEYDLDEEFEDKAHLRNHLMVTLNRHFDDLEADAADTGGFYAKDSSGEVRYIPESRKFEWLESEQDRIDDMLSEFPDFNSATKYPDDYLIPGGQNYREILYKLPDDKVEGSVQIRQPHFDGRDEYLWLHPMRPTAPLTAHRHSLQKRSSPTGQLQERSGLCK
jgi:hypothetical protein